MFLPLCLLLSVFNWCLCVDLTYFVEEGKDPGTLVGNIAADSHLTDRIPLGERKTITFSQLRTAQTGSSQLFRVSEKSGKLYTLHILDAEVMCKRYQECSRVVEVAVQKGTSFIKVLEIKVILKDVNDFQPEFRVKQVNIQFSEGDAIGMRKSIPNAIDKDVGVMNSKITYKLMKNMNDPFSLSVSKRVDGTSQLFINLEEKLDREVKDSYMIQVVAKDGGSPPKQSELDLNITVTDVNDNLPIFSQKVYNVTIKNEPSDTLPVAILSASDFDIGKNGRVSYEFSLQTSDIAKVHFKLNKVTGEVFLHKKFTLGQELLHKLYVKATDGGSPPLSSIVMILVNVINQQNNAPTIDVNFVSRSMGKENTVAISEDIEVGSFIAYVKVTDHDAGQNGKISCILHHDKFQLQSLGPKRYKVLVKKPLDRETQDHHDVIISCQDKGSPPLHCESEFSIRVMDVNDVQPTFAKKTFKFWIYENEKPNFPVGYINATDPDLGPGSKLTYFLIADNKYFLPFQITDNGLISTVMSLDHEFQDVYKFQVLVKDKGRPSLNNTVNVVVEVRDENDNSPYFTYPSVNPFSLDVIYYPRHTKNITVLKASDSDGRENAFLKYEITKGNDKQLFTINPYTGLLSFTRVVIQQDAGSYDLQFAVKDSGTPVLSATTTIFLTLTVSNKTFEMINVVQMKADEADEKIHLDFLIAIVSVAVTLSVIITAFISICFLRLTNQKNISHRNEGGNCSVKCEQRQLMYPYLASSCIDLPSTRIEEVDINRDFHLMERGDSQRGDNSDNGQSGSATIMHLQTTPEVVYQEIGAMSWSRKGKRTTLVVPNNQREISMLSSHSDSVDDWNKGDTTHNNRDAQAERIKGLVTNRKDIYYSVVTNDWTSHNNTDEQYSSHYSLAHAPWTDFNTFMKPIKQRFSCPGDTRMSPRCSFKPKMGNVTECRQQVGLAPAKPWTLPESRRPNFDFPQLPTVGQSDYQGNVDHLVQIPLPKYYVLEPNPDNSPQKLHSDSSGEVEHSLQLPLPKYYVLESNMEGLPHSGKRQENSAEVDRSVPLPLPKYHVLEPETQTRPQISHTQAPDQKV